MGVKPLILGGKAGRGKGGWGDALSKKANRLYSGATAMQTGENEDNVEKRTLKPRVEITRC